MEERRLYNSEVKIENDNIISGIGIVYNKESRQFITPNGRKVVEIIRPEAVDGLLEDPDIRAYHSHQKHMILGRNLKTMKLTTDEVGTHYNIDISGDIPSYTRDLQYSIKRGDVDTSSFGFTLPDKQSDGMKIHYRGDGIFVREITRFKKITDMSPMGTIEAYPDTSVSLRGIDDFAEDMGKKGSSYIKELIEMYKELI